MPDAKRTSPADPQVLAFFHQELARTAAPPGLAAAGSALWPRFAGYYQGLARLPRKVRRALQRRWRRSLTGLALLCVLGQAPALAATIAVGGSCTLVDAVTAANADALVGGCAAGSGADTITLPILSTHTLTTVNNEMYGVPTGLPVVTSEITIVGSIATITRDSSAPPFRILTVGATGDLTLVGSTVTGGISAGFLPAGGGIENRGTAALTDSRILSNRAFLGAGIDNVGTMTLTNTTVSGNTAVFGGGITNSGTLTLTDSRISSNTAVQYGGGGIGGGISNAGTVTLDFSTVSGNTAGSSGGGVDNDDLLTLTNSTVSGNTAADSGGGVENNGTVTFTNNTVTGNASGRVAGGLFNTGTVTLVQSLLSGNTAPVNGPEAYSVAGQSGGGAVIADGFNVFGHDGSPGIAGFTLGASDFVPADPLAAILDPTLGYNGGATRTHALVFGSPAVDAVLGAACATGTDQRGAPRAQDGDGDTFADCDSGAVERGQVPVQASLNSTRLDCRTAACQVPVTCNLTEERCTNEVEVTVRRPRRNSDGTATKAARPIRFAFGVANIPSGGIGTVTLELTKRGKRLVRETKKRRLKGVLGIREIAATVSNTPLTISRTNVTIRLKRRK